MPLLGPEIWHLPPGVKDDGRLRVGLGVGERAAGEMIVNDAGGGGIGVDPVRRSSERQGRMGRGFLAHAVRFIEKGGGLETSDRDFMDVRDGEVGVKRFFEGKRGLRVVRDGELQAEAAADRDLEGEPKVVESKVVAELGWAKSKSEVEIAARERGKGDRPGLKASEAMRWTGLSIVTVRILIHCKPRKGNWNAAADRFARSEVRFSAEIEDRSLTCGLPVGEVGALEVNGRVGFPSGDLCTDESVRLFEAKYFRNGEVVVESGEVHDLPSVCG